MKLNLFFIFTLFCCLTIAAFAVDPTIVDISKDVVRPEIQRMGINLGGDAWYDGSMILKERIPHGSFEGSIYRIIEWGPGGDEKSIYLNMGSGKWDDVLRGAKYTIVTGPGMGHTGKVTNIIANMPFLEGGNPNKRYLKIDLDSQGPMKPYADTVIILEKQVDTGFLGQHGGSFWVFTDGDAKVTTEKGDVRPEAKVIMVAVLTAKGTPDVATISAPLAVKTAVDVNGIWKLNFWARGDGKLTLGLGTWKPSAAEPSLMPQKVELTNEWKKYEYTFDVKNYPYPAICIHMIVTGGVVKLDDVSMQLTGDKNPTAFRDPLVNTLKKFQPGTLRLLQMGGSSLENFLRPAETRMTYTGQRNENPITSNIWPGHPKQNEGAADSYQYGMHEFLELCKEVGCDPWVCIPGTLTPSEMSDLMEYLNGSEQTTFGKLRADRGQVKPWTSVFKNINIEFGNEAWNWSMAYNHRGFNGRDYWRTLIGFAKMAPCYSNKVKFQIGGQAVSAGSNGLLAAEKWNADGFAVAPYIIHEMSAVQAKQSDEEIWSWVFGYPWYNGTQGYMAQNYKAVTKPLGIELSVYEVNHHITGGDAPAEARNKIVAGIGGGLNVANWMMMMLEKQNVRVQNLFSLLQFEYKYGAGNVRLWGTALSMKTGSERYRPTFQTVSLLNQVLTGDLVKVTKSGTDPKWTCSADYGSKNKPFDVPYLQVYATKDDEKRGFVIFNLHRTDSLPFIMNFTGGVQPGSVKKWTLSADKIDANNEPDHDEQVKIVEETLEKFASGNTITIKPFSMVVIRWEEPRDKSVKQFTTTSNPSGPWSYLAACYGNNSNGTPAGYDMVKLPPVKMLYDKTLNAWKSPTSNAQITADGIMYHNGPTGNPNMQSAPVLSYNYTGKDDNTISVKVNYQTLGRDGRDLLVFKNKKDNIMVISATEDAVVKGTHMVGTPESGTRIQYGNPYEAQIKEVATTFEVKVKNGDTIDFAYTGLWDPRWEIPRLQVVVDKRN